MKTQQNLVTREEETKNRYNKCFCIVYISHINGLKFERIREMVRWEISDEGDCGTCLYG